jgi:predicted nucleic acid-binding protein
MYLLDTNVISELRKPTGKANSQVISWAKRVDSSDLYLSAISIFELEKGILQRERKDIRQGKILRQWFDQQVLPSFLGRILPVDQAVAIVCAKLHIPDPKPERDALIAATALVHNMTVVTRNTKDFQYSSVLLLNPWD